MEAPVDYALRLRCRTRDIEVQQLVGIGCDHPAVDDPLVSAVMAEAIEDHVLGLCELTHGLERLLRYVQVLDERFKIRRLQHLPRQN